MIDAAEQRCEQSAMGWPWLGDGRRRAMRLVGGFVWLLFIVFPLANAVAKRGTLLGHVLVVAGSAAFVAAYVVVVLLARRHWSRTPERTGLVLALFVVLLAVSFALTIGDASGWGFLFTYCAACAGLTAPVGFGMPAVAACALLAGVSSAVGGASGGTTIGFIASSAGIGMLLLVMRDLRIRNVELTEARAELARHAVAQERERFARDLHDLLGHSLSVIALKAELAGRLLPGRPHDAAVEVGELEQVARGALGEVREAVSGYRQPTLDGELAGARMALAAAGVEAEIERPTVALDPPVEAILAWAVREGATNVIRHSGARRCTVRITTSLIDAGAEIVDDGRGAGLDVGRGGVDGLDVGRGVVGGLGAGWGGAGGLDGGRGGVGGLDRSGANGLEAARRRGSIVERVRPAAGAQNGNGSRPPGATPATAGHGLTGLAERARSLHGRVEAGPLAEGGFRLAVTVPLPGPVIRVLLAEDQRMVRGALASLLGLEADIEVVAQVSRGDEVLAAARAARPDVALLDIEMPGRTGLDAAEELGRELPGCRVLILTTFGRPGYLRRAMEAGAAGFLLKDAPASELAEAIRRAVAGERIVDPGLAAAALSQGESPLTAREHEVLAASRAHATIAELASALYLSQGTVRNHLSSVMQKLGARNRVEAARLAEEKGWL